MPGCLLSCLTRSEGLQARMRDSIVRLQRGAQGWDVGPVAVAVKLRIHARVGVRMASRRSGNWGGEGGVGKGGGQFQECLPSGWRTSPSRALTLAAVAARLHMHARVRVRIASRKTGRLGEEFQDCLPSGWRTSPSRALKLAPLWLGTAAHRSQSSWFKHRGL